MTMPSQPLSPVEAELLRQILNDGNAQVGQTVEMIFGEHPEEIQVKTRMEKLADVRDKFPMEPMSSVKIGFEGDINGVFLFLQPQSMSRGTRDAFKAMFSGNASATRDAAGYVRNDWVSANRASASISDDRYRDALGELSNILFGNYLTAIYSRCSLATFQELPDVLNPDNKMQYLMDALNHFTGRAERCFLAEVRCSVGGNRIHFWLVMMAEPEGFRAMLQSIKKT